MPTFQLCMHLLNNPKKKWCYQQQKQQKQQQQQWRQMPKNVYNKYSLRWATCNMWVITIVKFAVICGVFHARSYFEYWSLLWLYVTSRKHIYNNVHGDFAWKIAVKTHHLYCRSFIQPLFVSILVKSAVWDIFRCCFFNLTNSFELFCFGPSMNHMMISCVMVSGHVESLPVCSHLLVLNLSIVNYSKYTFDSSSWFV